MSPLVAGGGQQYRSTTGLFFEIYFFTIFFEDFSRQDFEDEVDLYCFPPPNVGPLARLRQRQQSRLQPLKRAPGPLARLLREREKGRA